MRFMRIFAFLMFLVPFASFGAQNDFMVAAQLLAAAKNADIQQVEILVNNGADVNYVDSTGLSIVCTALMNNDLRAAQILQMYGADASKCDRQIKQYNSKNKPRRSGGLFGGLSSAQSITLAAAGAAVVVGGLFLLTDLLDPGNDNKSSSSGGSHGGGGGGGGSTPNPAFTLPYGPAMTDAAAEKSEYTNNLNFYSPADESSSYYKNYTLMNNSAMDQNYLLMMHGYSAMARGYNGMRTLRYMDTGHTPVPKSILDGHAVSGYVVEGGRPVNVALITTNGINMHGKPAGEYTAAVDSLDDRLVAWTQLNGSSVVEPEYTNLASKYYNNAITFGSTAETKVADSTTAEDETMVNFFDLSGNGTAVENADASDYDNLLAKVVGGANSGFSNPDYMGFMPNGQMTIFRTGGGSGFLTLASPTNAGTYTLNSGGDLSSLTISASGADIDVTMDSNLVSGIRIYNGYIESGDILHLNINGSDAPDVEYSMVLNAGSETNGLLVSASATPSEDVGTYTLTSDGSLATLTIAGIASGAELHTVESGIFDTSFVLNNGLSGYIGSDGVLYLDTGNGVYVAYSMALSSGSETEGVLQTGPEVMGTYTLASSGDLETLTIADVASGAELVVTVDGTTVVATNNSDTYSGYVGTDGLLYFDTDSDGVADVAYSMNLTTGSDTDGTLQMVKVLSSTDYYNYKALRNAASLYMAGDVGARSRPDIFANASVIEPLHATDTPTVSTLLSVNPDITDKSVYNVAFTAYVNSLYGDDDGTYQPGTDSYNFFYNLGSAYLPLVLFSTGAVETDSSYSGEAVDATFENAAPLVYDNLEHLFASIVAVGQKGSTPYSGNISSYSPSGKYVLTQWQNINGTPDDTSDDTYYRARMCGVGGMGINGIDPWCFASVGVTDELAVASAAGAFGAMKSAFPYLDNKQIFALAALTADGAYLGTLNGKATTTDALTSYLQGLYELPYEYQAYVDGGEMDYLDAFKLVFGYGVINVERATTPGKSIYYYNGTDIVSTSGDAYWRVASNTAFRGSSAFGARDVILKTSAFDVLTSVDGELSLPRVWTNEFALGANSKHGLYMGDVLGELKTRDDELNRVQIGKLGFSMAMSQRAYNDNMGGLDNMKLDWQSGNWNFAGGYQRYFTDGASRFAGMNNPILGLASNAVVSDAKYDLGNWSFGARAFSGNITDESLVEHDPTVAAMYEPARLGLMHGASTSVAWNGERFGFNTTIGTANETNTVLGAYTDGLLNMGAGQTIYVDNEMSFRPIDKLKLTARATFARTTTDGAGDFIMGVSSIESNAFGIGAEIGNFRFSVAQPLAVRHGALKYAYADYNVVDTDDGNFALDITDTHVAEIDLSAKTRELRFTGEYRHNFGEFTDGALGFIYRVNPNNTDEFGNESIFMLKLTHRVGI